MNNTALDDLVGKGYAAQVLKKHPLNVALDTAALAFVATPSLQADAQAELDRLNAMGEGLERRCYVSARRRDFLAAALAHPAPTKQQQIDAATLNALPQPAVMPLGDISDG